MSVTISWQEIAIRLALALLAGAVIGVNRGEHGRPAGLRTTLLVCLAAAVTMIQVNLLIGTKGKPSDSFVQLDMMRLPLGLLSGMGFIGAGAIVRKGSLVTGVTTAATLWFVTILGLCFGGGQLALGSTALAIGFLVLWLLRSVERRIKQDKRAELVVVAAADGLREEQITARVTEGGCRIVSSSILLQNRDRTRRLHFDVRWRGVIDTPEIPSFVQRIAQEHGVERVEWNAR
jgi:putative Mg2+ transporter-C (MgtC) family protein